MTSVILSFVFIGQIFLISVYLPRFAVKALSSPRWRKNPSPSAYNEFHIFNGLMVVIGVLFLVLMNALEMGSARLPYLFMISGFFLLQMLPIEMASLTWKPSRLGQERRRQVEERWFRERLFSYWALTLPIVILMSIWSISSPFTLTAISAALSIDPLILSRSIVIATYLSTALCIILWSAETILAFCCFLDRAISTKRLYARLALNSIVLVALGIICTNLDILQVPPALHASAISLSCQMIALVLYQSVILPTASERTPQTELPAESEL